AAISWSPPMNSHRDAGRVRPLALALVALAGMGIALLMTRPHAEPVAAPAKAHRTSVLSSFAPAAKAAAHAVPPAPKPVEAAPARTVSPTAEAPRRHAASIVRAPVVQVQAAAESPPAKTDTGPSDPPDINTPRIPTDTPPPPPEPLTITDTQIVA